MTKRSKNMGTPLNEMTESELREGIRAWEHGIAMTLKGNIKPLDVDDPRPQSIQQSEFLERMRRGIDRFEKELRRRG